MRILGIDPGSTTGLVLIWARGDTVAIEHHDHLSALMAAGEVESLLISDAVGIHTVAIERFTISPRTLTGSRSGSLDALYTIGAVRYLCDREGVPMHLQAPAAAKNAFSDQRLRDLDLTGTVGPHERDALRHALLLATTQRIWSGVVNATALEGQG